MISLDSKMYLNKRSLVAFSQTADENAVNGQFGNNKMLFSHEMRRDSASFLTNGKNSSKVFGEQATIGEGAFNSQWFKRNGRLDSTPTDDPKLSGAEGERKSSISTNNAAVELVKDNLEPAAGETKPFFKVNKLITLSVISVTLKGVRNV